MSVVTPLDYKLDALTQGFTQVAHHQHLGIPSVRRSSEVLIGI